MKIKRKPGVKVEPGLGGPVERHTVTFDEMTGRKLRVLGGGNVSKGIREAARVAYDRYQAQR